MTDLSVYLKLIYIYACCAVGCTDISSNRFVVQSRPNMKMTQPQLVLSVSTKLACAVECTNRPESCLSFVYTKQNKSCLLGSWVVPDATATTPKQLYQYSTGSFCNTTANFRVVRKGSVSVCMWLSTYEANWSTARSRCQAIGAQLYTLKTLEKLEILIDLLSGTNFETFLGLSDRVTEGTFVWEDGTVLDNTWKKVIFAEGQPDNYQKSQDCVTYSPQIFGLDDAGCSLEFRFLCEINQYGI